MLSQEQILENKQKYVELLLELGIDITPLMKYLESDRVNYFNKPYIVLTEDMYDGSLCEHALKVYNNLIKIVDVYCPDKYSKQDLIIVSLFKDIYRAELYESYNRNVKNEQTKAWEEIKSYRIKDIRPIFGDYNFSSYMIARKFIDLSNDELVEAICYSWSNNNNLEISNIRKDYKLVTLLTMAEMAACYLGDI